MIVSISIEHRFVSRYCLPGLRQRPVQETAEVKTRAEADLGDDAWSVITERRHTLCLQVKTTRVAVENVMKIFVDMKKSDQFRT